jgi:hypothetical protein
MADKDNTPKTITKDELIVALKDDAEVCIVNMGRLVFAIVQLDADPRGVTRARRRES